MNHDQPSAFRVEAAEDGEASLFTVSAGGETRRYRVAGGEQQDYAAFFAELARVFGTRKPHIYERPAEPPTGDEPDWRPLITENVSPRILCGYGDPAVLKTDDGYILVATSN